MLLCPSCSDSIWSSRREQGKLVITCQGAKVITRPLESGISFYEFADCGASFELPPYTGFI